MTHEEVRKALFERYTNVEALTSWVESGGDPAKCFRRAARAVYVTSNPGYRFGIETVPSETKRAAQELLDRYDAIRCDVAREYRKLSSTLTHAEVSIRIDLLGFYATELS